MSTRASIQGADRVDVRVGSGTYDGKRATTVSVTIHHGFTGRALARFGRLNEYLGGQRPIGFAQGEWLSRGGIYVGSRTDTFYYAGTARFHRGSTELRHLRALARRPIQARRSRSR